MKMPVRKDRSGADTIAALKEAAQLFGDDKYQELAGKTFEDVTRAITASLKRTCDAGYDVPQAMTILSVVLTKTLARVCVPTMVTPADLGRLMEAELIDAREGYEKERKGKKHD